MYTTLISAEQLVELRSHTSPVIFDCRFNLAAPEAGYQAYCSGHIPGAYYLHLDHDLSSPSVPGSGRHPLPDIERFAATIERCGVDNETQIVLCDDCGGAMAARAWWLFRFVGHEQVALLDGGIQAWQKVVTDLSTKQPTPSVESKAFQIKLQAEANLSTEQLIELLPDKIRLVDARAAERFAGKVEPIDPVAGHIPGAINRPLTDNLLEGRFKSAEQLRQEWQHLLGDIKPQQVVHMCGSGVTACHNLLSMEIAGLSGSRLYAGSWSEWIQEPKRAIVLGD